MNEGNVLHTYIGEGQIQVFKNDDWVNRVPLNVPVLQTDELKNSAGVEYALKTDCVTQETLQDVVDQINEKFDSISAATNTCMFPVGSVVNLPKEANPSEIYGGTWSIDGVYYTAFKEVKWEHHTDPECNGTIKVCVEFNGHRGTIQVLDNQNFTGSYRVKLHLNDFSIDFDHFINGITAVTSTSNNILYVSFSSVENNYLFFDLELLFTDGRQCSPAVFTLISEDPSPAFANCPGVNYLWKRTA